MNKKELKLFRYERVLNIVNIINSTPNLDKNKLDSAIKVAIERHISDKEEEKLLREYYCLTDRPFCVVTIYINGISIWSKRIENKSFADWIAKNSVRAIQRGLLDGEVTYSII